MQNQKYSDTNNIRVKIAGLSSGNPGVFNTAMGGTSYVAVSGTDSEGFTTVVTRGVFDLEVEARDSGGSSDIVDFDMLYFDDADTPKISKDDTGTLFGIALTDGATITGGTTSTIKVLIK